jgi:phosphoribosylamine--glycine ligase
MNILILGSGGREHAMAWKAAQSDRVTTVYCAPGNPGMAALAKGVCVDVNPEDVPALAALIEEKSISLVLVGPEGPLAAGVVDGLAGSGALVFGPCKAAARLEASKTFAKEFMERHHIPTAAYRAFTNADEARAYVDEIGVPLVVKADGLAAGKGVTVAFAREEALRAIDDAMVGQVFGAAGAQIIIEAFLVGEEASILAFCDGRTVVPMASSQDHKAAYDGDLGPNTGGMGAYSPAPVVTPALMEEIQRTVLQPCVDGMVADGSPYIGVLYAGLMITKDGPKVVEFNCRFGDPETQVVLPRLTTDLIDVAEACCRGTLDQVDLVYTPNPCAAVVLASAGYPGDYTKGLPISGIEAADAIDGVTVFHAGTREQGGQLLTQGGRVLAVSALGSSLQAALDNAYAGVGKVSFEGMQYRKDIGQKAFKHLS